MRKIDTIIIHCTATFEFMDVNLYSIDRWHRLRGWDGCGYHYVVLRDGTIAFGRHVSRVGAHCKGMNAHSIGVAYVGGLGSNGEPSDTRTEAQKEGLYDLISFLKRVYDIKVIAGHNEFSSKECPCFNVKEEYAQRE